MKVKEKNIENSRERCCSKIKKQKPKKVSTSNRLTTTSKKTMATRRGARAAAIPPLPLPPKRSEHSFLDASPLIESIAAVAPLPDAGSRRRSQRAIDVGGDGGAETSNHGVVAGAWLSADNSRGIAWEVEPEVREVSDFYSRGAIKRRQRGKGTRALDWFLMV